MKLLMLLGLMATTGLIRAQAIDQEKSANAAAVKDKKFITDNMRYDEDVVFLAQKGIERATDARVKELAEQVETDHSAMLYSMEQLLVAGTGESTQQPVKADKTPRMATPINLQLQTFSGGDFDSVWVANLLNLHQAKYDELVQVKETVMNTQLKMRITEAIPLVRKNLSQLKSVQKYLIKLATQRRKEAAAAAKAGKTR
jgi:predicted outer membrane protein